MRQERWQQQQHRDWSRRCEDESEESIRESDARRRADDDAAIKRNEGWRAGGAQAPTPAASEAASPAAGADDEGFQPVVSRKQTDAKLEKQRRQEAFDKGKKEKQEEEDRSLAGWQERQGITSGNIPAGKDAEDADELAEPKEGRAKKPWSEEDDPESDDEAMQQQQQQQRDADGRPVKYDEGGPDHEDAPCHKKKAIVVSGAVPGTFAKVAAAGHAVVQQQLLQGASSGSNDAPKVEPVVTATAVATAVPAGGKGLEEISPKAGKKAKGGSAARGSSVGSDGAMAGSRARTNSSDRPHIVQPEIGAVRGARQEIENRRAAAKEAAAAKAVLQGVTADPKGPVS